MQWSFNKHASWSEKTKIQSLIWHSFWEYVYGNKSLKLQLLYSAVMFPSVPSFLSSCHQEQHFWGPVCFYSRLKETKWPWSLSSIAITGSVQQVERCSHPVGPFRLPALLTAKSCGSVPACDLSVSTASVSIAFHSPVDRVPLFALATTDRWPDLLFEDNVINPQVSSTTYICVTRSRACLL